MTVETAIQHLVWAHAHAPEVCVGAGGCDGVRGGQLPCDPGSLRAGPEERDAGGGGWCSAVPGACAACMAMLIPPSSAGQGALRLTCYRLHSEGRWARDDPAPGAAVRRCNCAVYCYERVRTMMTLIPWASLIDPGGLLGRAGTAGRASMYSS
jgi:hypothetical protein